MVICEPMGDSGVVPAGTRIVRHPRKGVFVPRDVFKPESPSAIEAGVPIGAVSPRFQELIASRCEKIVRGSVRVQAHCVMSPHVTDEYALGVAGRCRVLAPFATLWSLLAHYVQEQQAGRAIGPLPGRRGKVITNIGAEHRLYIDDLNVVIVRYNHKVWDFDVASIMSPEEGAQPALLRQTRLLQFDIAL